MERQKTVVDANVVIKWFVGEPLSDKAEKLLQSHIEGTRFLYCPDLVMYELGNILYFKRMNEEDIKSAFRDILGFQIHIEKASTTLILNAIRIARTYNLTIYDASYAALAETIGGDLITADEQLSKLPCATHLKNV